MGFLKSLFGIQEQSDIHTFDEAIQASQEHEDIRQLLMLAQKTGDYNVTSDEGSSILTKATAHDKLNIVKFLIANGVDPNTKYRDGQTTALMVAAMSSRVKIAKYLLENGANPNLVVDGGMTALGCASVAGNIEIARLLIEKGANINEKNNYGITVLDMAEQKHQYSMVEFLKRNGGTNGAFGRFS